MAEMQPPGFMQALSNHTAILMRLVAQAALLNETAPGSTTLCRGGSHPAFGDKLVVSAKTPTAMQVSVGTGIAYVPGSNAFQGPYVCVNDSIVTLNIGAASATLHRRDLIIAKVNDTAHGGSTNNWILEVVQGSNSSSQPAPLPVPTGHFTILAEVTVNANTTAITGAMIANRNTYNVAIGGILPCSASDVPSNPYEGMAIWRRDLDELRVYTGSFWLTVIQASPYQYKFETVASADSGTTTSTSFTKTLSGAAELNTSFVCPPSGRMLFQAAALVTNSGSGSNWFGIRLEGPSGFVRDAQETESMRLASGQSAGPLWSVGGLTPGATYTAHASHKVVGGGTATYTYRRLSLWPLEVA